MVTGNLARQFRPDEMVVVGAYSLGSSSQTWAPDWPALKYASLELPDGFRGTRWIRWAQWPLVLLRAGWILIAQRCRAILVVFPDEVFLLAAYVLARLTNQPLYVYFHNTFLESRQHNRLARCLQPRVFAIARHLFVMSEGMRNFYRAKYPTLQCSALLHSFNGTLPQPGDVRLPPLHRPVRLILFGNIGPSNAEAAARFAQLVRHRPDVHLTVLGGTSRAYLTKLGFTGDQVTIDTVSYDVLMERIRENDIVLLPHGFYGPVAEEEFATIFPTRTIEALISERPILGHVPRDCFFAEFLRSHGCALIVDEPDVAALRDAVDRLSQNPALRLDLVRRALSAARHFQASTVASHLRNVMQNETLNVEVNRVGWLRERLLKKR